jgi:hypothetical protein
VRIVTAFWIEGPDEEELRSMDKHLVVYEGYFYRVDKNDKGFFLFGPGDRYMYDGTLPRARDDKDMPKKFSALEGGRDAYDLGYIGDFLNE